MRNRNLMIRKFENLDGLFATLRWQITNSQTVEQFVGTIEKGKEIIQELKNLIENEPITRDEV